MTRRIKPIAPDLPLAGVKMAIRDQLAADGHTQAYLAACAGVSEKHVSQVLTGKVVGS